MTTNITTPLPPEFTLALTITTHCLIVGSIIFHTAMAAIVLATPAKKLFLCTCKLGRYKNPPPDECGGIMNMS
jgi:hypothetical protein